MAAQRLAGPARRPLVREGGELVEADWDAAMDRIVERSKQLLGGPGGWGRFVQVPEPRCRAGTGT